MKRRRGKVNATGRNEGEGQYANFSYAMFHSPAWRTMSGAGVKLYLEIRSRFNGSNNGRIPLSWDEAARLLRMGKATVQRASREITERGFATVVRPGEWYGRKATLWRVNDKPCDGHLPTFDWKRWKPPLKTEVGSNQNHAATATGSRQNRESDLRFRTEPVAHH